MRSAMLILLLMLLGPVLVGLLTHIILSWFQFKARLIAKENRNVFQRVVVNVFDILVRNKYPIGAVLTLCAHRWLNFLRQEISTSVSENKVRAHWSRRNYAAVLATGFFGSLLSTRSFIWSAIAAVMFTTVIWGFIALRSLLDSRRIARAEAGMKVKELRPVALDLSVPAAVMVTIGLIEIVWLLFG